jgi:oligoendopeptidase F
VLQTESQTDPSSAQDAYAWDLADLYPDLTAWRAEMVRVAAEVPQVRTFAGRLRTSPQVLADALETTSRLDKTLTRLYVYAGMLSDEDTRLSEPQGMHQQMQQLYAEFGAQASYIEPEILRIGEATIETYILAEPRLAPYVVMLRDIARRAAHTLSDAEEKILADAQPLAGSATNIFGILSNADFPYPTIALTDGRSVKLDQSGYADVRTSPNREDRRTAMSTFFTALGGFSRTFGTTMNANVQKAVFYAKARKYTSTVEASLDRANIQVSVYDRLIEGVGRHLPSLHRYLRLRKRMMGVTDDLHYYDLYAPLVASVDLRYTPDEAQRHVVDALRPLGAEYVSVIERGFRERWLDWYPAEGKRSGAYSNGGAYDVHPYILLNYLGQYNDVSTLAHELGHTMHSYFSNKTQPFPTADYSIFVAEVASTFNEALLIDHMLEHITDKPTRLSLLGNYLESIKATVFRQTQFAEFELRVHEMGLASTPITGDGLAALYLDITRRYYGHEQRIVVVDDDVANEWSYIPHFYSEFYVYQYATSFTAAEALAAKVLAGDASATARFLTFLGAGSSKYPIDLLKDAGVDMTTDAPLDQTMQTMNRVMDEIEALLPAPSTR